MKAKKTKKTKKVTPHLVKPDLSSDDKKALAAIFTVIECGLVACIGESCDPNT